MHQTIYLKIITIITYLLRSIIMTQNILKFNFLAFFIKLDNVKAAVFRIV